MTYVFFITGLQSYEALSTRDTGYVRGMLSADLTSTAGQLRHHRKWVLFSFPVPVFNVGNNVM